MIAAAVIAVIGIAVGLMSYFLVYEGAPESEIDEVEPGVYKTNPDVERDRIGWHNLGVAGMIISGIMVLVGSGCVMGESYNYFRERNSKAVEVPTSV